MHERTQLSGKGQVVIPASVRARLRWLPGLRFDVVERGDSVTLQPRRARPAFAATTLADLAQLAPARQAQAVDAISGLDAAALTAILGDRDDQ